MDGTQGARYQAVLFDLDNTLADRTAAVVCLANALYDWQPSIRERVTRSDAVARICELDANGQAGRDLLMQRVLQEWPAVRHSHAELLQWYGGHYGRSFPKDPQVMALLEELCRTGMAWGIITNGSTHQWETLRALGMDSIASCVVISGEFGHHKPEPEVFLEALGRLGLEPSADILFVGDDPIADIQGARSVGLSTGWVRHGRTWPLSGFVPDHEIDHVAEVAPLLGVEIRLPTEQTDDL